MNKKINFCDIRPFIRYIGTREINENRIDHWIISRDSRLFWCISGSGTVLLKKGMLQVNVGQLLFIPAGSPYSFHPTSEEMLSFISVNFDFLYCENLGEYQIATLRPDNAAVSQEILDSIIHYTFADCPALNDPLVISGDVTTDEHMRLAHREFFYAKLHHQQITSALIQLVLVDVVRQLAAETITKVNRSDTIDRIIDYMKQHYAEKITVDDVAQHMGYHPDYINRLMHLHTGQTIIQYLTEYRITKAIRLIRSSDLSFSEIAEKTGFIDSSHFSRVFKSKVGKSPREFRSSAPGASYPQKKNG